MNISPMAIKRHKLYEEMDSHILSFSKEKGLTDKEAEELSSGLINTIANLFGGQNFCFPKDIGYDIKYRDLIIYREYKGSANCAELAKKYGVTERSIYKIIARVRKNLPASK